MIAAWTAALDASRTYDVIVLGVAGFSAGWALLPQSLQEGIRARVQAGTGLVVIRRGDVGLASGNPNPEANELKTLLPLLFQSGSDFHGPLQPGNDRTVRGLPWEIVPGFGPSINGYNPQTGAQVLVSIDYAGQPMPLLARTTYGTGRVLDLVWTSVVPLDFTRIRPTGTEGMDTLRYDLALLARVLCDAAGHEPGIAVRNVALVDDTATVDLEQVQATASAFVLDWVARDRFGLVLGTGRESASSFPASSSITFPIPSGTWTADVAVQPTTGELGWGAGARVLDFTVTADPDLAVLGREDIVRITPSGPVAATGYVVDLLDGRGRVLERVSVAAGASATVDAGRIETPRAEVRIHALNAAGRLIGQALRAFRIRARTGVGRWPIHFWNDAGVLLPIPLLVRHLDANTSLGISGYFLLPRQHEDVVAAADRLGVPYVVRSSGYLRTSGGEAPDGSGSPFSLTDGEAIASGRVLDTREAASFADANVLYYRVADDEPDPPMTDVSYDARTLGRFRAWLAETYGYADSTLQREWGGSATLATATPRSHAEAVIAFNAGDPTFAPWADHRRFMMDLFSRAPAQAREALRHGDPEALAGTSGDNRMGMATGRDWWVRGRALDLVGRYATSTAIELKSLGAQSIPWTGYDDPDPIIRHRVWTALGLGEDGLALFAETTLVNPDLSLPEVGRDLAAALLPARRGVEGLFAASRPADDRIFVLTSPDSSAVLAIHGYETLGTWASGTPPSQADLGGDAREGIHELLASMGVGWSAASPADIETGALERNRAEVLILPMCAALSDTACEAIRRWVAAGGRLIADLFPGTFTAHGRLRGAGIDGTGGLQSSNNPLDAVFGVTPGARPPISNVDVLVGGGAQFQVRCLDTALVAAPSARPGGTSLGGAPLWFTNSYHQGRAAYLGCSLFADYLSGRRADRLRMEEAFAVLLQSLDVAPRAWVVDAAGGRVELCQFRARSFGTTELVVLLRDYRDVAPEIDGELRFGAEAHTYDLDNGVYIGYGDRLKLRISSYTFRAFARLPYQVQDIDVRVAGRPRLRDSLTIVAALTVADGQPGSHRLRLDVLASDGRPLRYLSREVLAECGSATFIVPSAFNDPPGRWTIVVTDVTTGTQGRVHVHLGSRAAQPFPEPEPLQVDVVDD